LKENPPPNVSNIVKTIFHPWGGTEAPPQGWNKKEEAI